MLQYLKQLNGKTIDKIMIESRSVKIHFKTENEFNLKFNKLNVRADMPYSIRDDIPNMTSIDIKCRTVFYYN